jgi:DNA ligase 4
VALQLGLFSKYPLAGNYGSGKRGGGVSTLICAVFDDEHPNDEEPKYKYIPLRYSFLTTVADRYRTFVRIGSGLSFADYVWVRAKPWKTWDPKEPPSFLLTANKSHDDKGDVYLEPEEYASTTGFHITLAYSGLILSSFIIKIKAAEITKSGEGL